MASHNERLRRIEAAIDPPMARNTSRVVWLKPGRDGVLRDSDGTEYGHADTYKETHALPGFRRSVSFVIQPPDDPDIQEHE